LGLQPRLDGSAHVGSEWVEYRSNTRIGFEGRSNILSDNTRYHELGCAIYPYLRSPMATNPMADTRQTVLITGCAPGGIGHSLACNFHEAGRLQLLFAATSIVKDQFIGLRVFATARSASALEDLAARGIETFSLDVTSLEDIRRARDTIDGLTGGKLDILVNNA
jgi:hypothetical protein